MAPSNALPKDWTTAGRIPSYQDWLTETNRGAFKPRSKLLQRVDQAIKQWNLTPNADTTITLSNAIDVWRRSNPEWEKRNKTGTISKTMSALAHFKRLDFHAKFTSADVMALQCIREEREALLQRFIGKDVTFKGKHVRAKLKEAVDDFKSDVRAAPGYVQKLTPQQAVNDLQGALTKMAAAIFCVDNLTVIGDIMSYISPLIGQCAASAAPFVSNITGIYNCCSTLAIACKKVYEENDAWKHVPYAIDTGTPSAAFKGLSKCMERETNSALASAANASVSFAAQTALIFADGGVFSGPAVGLASWMASVSQTLMLLAMEWRATNKYNELIAAAKASQDKLDWDVFKVYPLIGCYYLVIGNTSDIIPIDYFGERDWMTRFERVKRDHFDSIYDKACDLIDASPWEIIGLPKRKQGTSLTLGSLASFAFDQGAGIVGQA